MSAPRAGGKRSSTGAAALLLCLDCDAAVVSEWLRGDPEPQRRIKLQVLPPAGTPQKLGVGD